jgi:hypothetical protein
MKLKGKFQQDKFKSKIYFTIKKKDNRHYSVDKISIKNLRIYNKNCYNSNKSCYLLSSDSSLSLNSSSLNSSEKEHKLYVGKICVLHVNNLKINTEIEKIEYPVVRFKFISTGYIVYDIEKYYSNGKATLELEWNDGTIEIKEISMV